MVADGGRGCKSKEEQAGGYDNMQICTQRGGGRGGGLVGGMGSTEVGGACAV